MSAQPESPEQKADTERLKELPVLRRQIARLQEAYAGAETLNRAATSTSLEIEAERDAALSALEKEKAEREAIVDAQADGMEKEARDPQLNEFARQQAEYDAKLLRRTFATLASQETDQPSGEEPEAVAEFNVTIRLRMTGSEAQVNDRIDKALDRAFPSTRKDVLELSWESREDRFAVWTEETDR